MSFLNTSCATFFIHSIIKFLKLIGEICGLPSFYTLFSNFLQILQQLLNLKMVLPILYYLFFDPVMAANLLLLILQEAICFGLVCFSQEQCVQQNLPMMAVKGKQTFLHGYSLHYFLSSF